MQAMDGASVQKKYRQLGPYLDERARRLWAAAEAEQLGYGGVSAVAAATSLSRTTVLAGQRELKQPAAVAGTTRRRKPGAGRKRLASGDPLLLEALEKLVEPETRGDPMRPLRWTCKSTSKWNKIEHRVFCHITQNWRGQPLVSHEVVVQLIGATTTEKGLRIQAEIDPKSYPLKKKISAQQLAEVQITRHDFHGEWNYSIKPRRQSG